MEDDRKYEHEHFGQTFLDSGRQTAVAFPLAAGSDRDNCLHLLSLRQHEAHFTIPPGSGNYGRIVVFSDMIAISRYVPDMAQYG